jgi:hypothetical protein
VDTTVYTLSKRVGDAPGERRSGTGWIVSAERMAVWREAVDAVRALREHMHEHTTKSGVAIASIAIEGVGVKRVIDALDALEGEPVPNERDAPGTFWMIERKNAGGHTEWLKWARTVPGSAEWTTGWKEAVRLDSETRARFVAKQEGCEATEHLVIGGRAVPCVEAASKVAGDAPGTEALRDASVIRRVLHIPPMGEEDVFEALSLGAARIRAHTTAHRPARQRLAADTLHDLREHISRALRAASLKEEDDGE